MELARDTTDTTALLTRAGQLIDLGRPGAARPLLAAVRGLAAPSAELSLLAARLALSDGQFDDAGADWARLARGFEELNRRFPRSIAYWNEYANLACRAGDAPQNAQQNEPEHDQTKGRVQVQVKHPLSAWKDIINQA